MSFARRYRWVWGLLPWSLASMLIPVLAMAKPWPHWDSVISDAEKRLQAQVKERLSRLPHPIEIKWAPRRIADFDFGDPVLAAAPADVVPGGAEELVVVTAEEIIILGGIGRRRAEVLARATLPGADAKIRPRDPVGDVVMVRGSSGPELWVRSSARAKGTRYSVSLPLAPIGEISGFPVCPGKLAKLVAGKNQLSGAEQALPDLFYGARCARDFFDVTGHPAAGQAVLEPGHALTVKALSCTSPGSGCSASGAQQLEAVGSAYSLADLDRDGLLEVVAAAANAPGTSERVTVFELRGSRMEVGYHHDFKLGAASVVIGQFDDDTELEVLSVHRRFRRTPVELWLWN